MSDLAGGQEQVHALSPRARIRAAGDVDQQSALDLADDGSRNAIELLVVLDEPVPVTSPVSLPLGEHDQTEIVFDFFEQDFDRLAG